MCLFFFGGCFAAIYDRVQGNHPGSNRFDLSHSHFLTMKVGKLYPVMCKEMYPGDVFKVSDAVHCELQPMVAPLLSDLNMYCHTFFVPYRLIYGVDHDDGKSLWEKFITGGEDGDYDTPLPAWNPTWSKVGFLQIRFGCCRQSGRTYHYCRFRR